jgi:hypothetical protein
VAIYNPNWLSSVEIRVCPVIYYYEKLKKNRSLNEPDVRKRLVVSISQRIEELRLHNLVQNLKISKHGLKAVSSNTSGSTVPFFWSDDRGFLKEEVKTCLIWHQCPPSITRQLSILLSSQKAFHICSPCLKESHHFKKDHRGYFMCQ